MSLIRISRNIKNNSIIVFKEILGNKVPLYEFPTLPSSRCMVCQTPTTLKYCRYHKAFEQEGLPRLISSVNIIGYFSTDYNGKPQNKLSELIKEVKKELVEKDIINIFISITEFLLRESNLDTNLITYIPSRPSHNSIKIIANEIARDLNITLIPSEKYIQYNDIGLTRDITDYKQRKEFIIRKFTKKISTEKNNKILGKLLIVDDIINTGWTISRIASILKEFFPKISIVKGFCFGKLLPKGKILGSNLIF